LHLKSIDSRFTHWKQ